VIVETLEQPVATAATRLPRVSIGMPVYNGAGCLAEAIESILDQTLGDLDLIICDNASTDETASICRAYAQRDDRVRYYRNRCNLGAAANYNGVFRRARGAYFKWAAHDDRLAPTFVERCAGALDEAPRDVVLCFPGSVIIGADGRAITSIAENPAIRLDEDLDLRMREPHRRLRHFMRHMSLCHPVFGLIRTDVLRRTRLIDRFHSSDVVLLTELALRGRFWQLPEPLFHRRLHAGTSLWNRTPQQVAAWFDPSRRHRFVFRYHRLLLEQVRSVHRTPLTGDERLRCYGVLVRDALIGRRGALAREIWTAVRQPLGLEGSGHRG
jgi:glycosyltransferase involved in cell wall biosynthesis